MVYNTQNYWVFGLCPSSGILETRKHNVSETGYVSETLCCLVSRIPDNRQSQKPVILINMNFAHYFSVIKQI
jgi:hypothetical protein